LHLPLVSGHLLLFFVLFFSSKQSTTFKGHLIFEIEPNFFKNLDSFCFKFKKKMIQCQTRWNHHARAIKKERESKDKSNDKALALP